LAISGSVQAFTLRHRMPAPKPGHSWGARYCASRHGNRPCRSNRP